MENTTSTEKVDTIPELPEHVSAVGDHGEILRLKHGTYSGSDGFAVWPVAPGDDSVLLQYRDYGRQAAAIAYELDGETARIAADTNLSDTGKKAAIKAAKETALNRETLIAEKVEKFGEKVRSQVSEPLPATRDYDAARPWEWAQDFELIRTLREMPAPERGALMVELRQGGAQRIADALLRNPRELTGIPSAQLAEIKRAAQQRLSPEPYARRDGIERSGAALAQVMRKVAAKICSSEHGVAITGSDRRALLGDRARYVE
jgi:hypothetical protein